MRSAECGSTDLSALIGPEARLGVLVACVDRDGVTGEGIPAAARWILWCELFADYGRGGGIKGPHGSVFLAIDGHGAVMEAPSMHAFCGAEFKRVMESMLTWLHPAFLAISFLHCPGVRVEDHRLDFSRVVSPAGAAHLRAMLLSVNTHTSRNT
jgi:hypothetical protein